MKIILSILILTAITINSNGQASIKLGYVNDHIGDSIKVCGKVYGGGRFTPTDDDSTLLISIGDEYPGQLLTLVIPKANRAQFTGDPANDWIGKIICITGRIHLYRDKPEIIVTNSAKIQVIE